MLFKCCLILPVALAVVNGLEVLFQLNTNCLEVNGDMSLTAVYNGTGTVVAVEWYYSRRDSANLVITASNCASFGIPDIGYPPPSRMIYQCPSTGLQANTYKLIIKSATEQEINSTWGAAFRIMGAPPTTQERVDGKLCSGATTPSSSTAIPITSSTSTTTTHLVTPNTTSSTSTSTTTTATAGISTSTTTTTSIKTATKKANSTVPTQIVTKSEQIDSITVVIVVPSVVGGLFVIGVAVTVALVWKFRKNQTLHSNRSKHHEVHSKKENKERHVKSHPAYSQYIPSYHHGFSAKELYGYKMYSGQSEIKRNPLYSYHSDRHMNMSYVTNRGQYRYDQLYNGNQFLVYQMQSTGADPLYTRRGHMIHPEHRYQYSTYPRATTFRTQDNTIVTDYSWNWN